MDENYPSIPDEDESESLFEIETDGILREFDEESLEEFVHDLILVFKILFLIDQNYGESEDSQLEKDIKKFKNLIKDWNEKYRDILLKYYTDGIQCIVSVYFDSTIRETAQLIANMKRFVDIRKNVNKIAAVFHDSDGSENTLTIVKENDMLRLVYAKEDMINPASPEFRLCAYFAMKNGFKKINLRNYGEKFSFDVSTEESIDKGYDWYSRYPQIRFRR